MAGPDLEAYEKISADELLKNKEDIQLCPISVIREKKQGGYANVDMTTFAVYFGKGSAAAKDVTFYISKNWREEVANLKDAYSGGGLEDEMSNLESSSPDTYEEEIRKKVEKFLQLSNEEKRDILANKKTVLSGIYEKVDPLEAEDAIELAEASDDAQIISKTSMTDLLKRIQKKEIDENQAKAENSDIIEGVRGVVDSVFGILNSKTKTQSFMDKIRILSHGTTYSHSNRVFMMFSEYLIHYNGLINKGLVQKMRLKFKKSYKDLYVDNLSFYEKDILVLENAIEGGMKRIDEEEITNYSLAALVHDIGKIHDIEYYEGDKPRDMDKISRHVYNGYALIVKTSEFPSEVAMIAAFHHEYYGHESGYGIYRDFLKAYRNRFGEPKYKFAVSYNYRSIEQFHAHAFFPVKMLEIVDIYDALTHDSNNRHSYPSKEALGILKRQFIEENFKIDPILYDIFVDYLMQSSQEDLSDFKIAK